LIAIKITDPREASFENVGLIELEDTETGELVTIDTGSAAFRNEFAAKAREDLQHLTHDFRKIDLDFINIRSDQPYVVPLINFFRSREGRR
jgi:hypothetical protein